MKLFFNQKDKIAREVPILLAAICIILVFKKNSTNCCQESYLLKKKKLCKLIDRCQGIDFIQKKILKN